MESRDRSAAFAGTRRSDEEAGEEPLRTEEGDEEAGSIDIVGAPEEALTTMEFTASGFAVDTDRLLVRARARNDAWCKWPSVVYGPSGVCLRHSRRPLRAFLARLQRK